MLGTEIAKIEMDNKQRLKQSRPLTSQTKLKCYCFFRVVLFIARIHVTCMRERVFRQKVIYNRLYFFYKTKNITLLIRKGQKI